MSTPKSRKARHSEEYIQPVYQQQNGNNVQQDTNYTPVEQEVVFDADSVNQAGQAALYLAMIPWIKNNLKGLLLKMIIVFVGVSFVFRTAVVNAHRDFMWESCVHADYTDVEYRYDDDADDTYLYTYEYTYEGQTYTGEIVEYSPISNSEFREGIYVYIDKNHPQKSEYHEL